MVKQRVHDPETGKIRWIDDGSPPSPRAPRKPKPTKIGPVPRVRNKPAPVEADEPRDHPARKRADRDWDTLFDDVDED